MEKSIEQLKNEKKAKDIGVMITDPYLYKNHIDKHRDQRIMAWMYGIGFYLVMIIALFNI